MKYIIVIATLAVISSVSGSKVLSNTVPSGSNQLQPASGSSLIQPAISSNQLQNLPSNASVKVL